MEKISVIIPVYNGGATIRQCLDSVFRQDYPNIEVVIVDGGSQDDTIAIIEEYSGRLNLRYVSEKDKGIYDAMNKGIDMASGDWLYFLGSDDVLYDSSVFSKVFSEKQVVSSDLVYGNVLLRESKMVYDGKFNAFRILKQNISHQAIFYRPGIFVKHGKYDLGYRIVADYVLNLAVFGDSALKKHYTNTIIAIFAESGLSGTSQGDKDFKRRRNSIIKRYFSFPFYFYGRFIVPFVQVIDKKVLKKKY